MPPTHPTDPQPGWAGFVQPHDGPIFAYDRGDGRWLAEALDGINDRLAAHHVHQRAIVGEPVSGSELAALARTVFRIPPVVNDLGALEVYFRHRAFMGQVATGTQPM